MSEIKKGYKKTKIGIIPNDWEVVRLGDIIKYKKGYAFKSSDYQNKGVPIIRVSDTGYNIIYDEKRVYISEKKAKMFKEYKLFTNDIIITTVGSRPPLYNSMVGKIILVSKKNENNLLNQNAVKIFSNIADNVFIFNQLSTNRYVKHIESIYRGNANQASITLKDLFYYKIPLPPLQEQKKIAKILTTWDRAIEKQEKLIETKERLKKGLMQRLLTGEVRFKEFGSGTLVLQSGGVKTPLPNGWEEVRLGEIGKFRSGFGFPEDKQGQINQKYPFYKVSDMNLKENEIYMKQENNSISNEILIQLKGKTIPKNSIIFAKVGIALLLDRRRITIKESCIDNNMMAFISNRKIVDIYFIYSKFLMIKFAKLANIGAIPSISAKDLQNLKIKLPPLTEQQKITKVLSTVDKEIELLKKELEEFKKQKKGLMQRLLSGEVRVKV